MVSAAATEDIAMRQITIAPGLNATRREPRRASVLAGMLEFLGGAMDMAASRRQLAALDARALRDIGVSRADALREAHRPWWRR